MTDFGDKSGLRRTRKVCALSILPVLPVQGILPMGDTRRALGSASDLEIAV